MKNRRKNPQYNIFSDSSLRAVKNVLVFAAFGVLLIGMVELADMIVQMRDLG